MLSSIDYLLSYPSISEYTWPHVQKSLAQYTITQIATSVLGSYSSAPSPLAP